MSISSKLHRLIIYPIVTYLKGYSVKNDLKDMLDSQYFSHEKILELQQKKLIKITTFAKKSEHYKDIPIFDPTEQPLDLWLKTLPILEKRDLRENFENLLTRNPSLWDSIKTSGGSTGAAVTVYKNREAMSKELASAWRGYKWANVEIGDLQARFWGVPYSFIGRVKSKLIDFVTHRIRFSAFRFSNRDLEGYKAIVARKKPSYFYGYVSMLREFSQNCQNDDQNYFKSVKSVICTSEVLTTVDRKLFAKTFGAKIFNEYGCGEVGTIAHECEFGNLHINDESLLLEVVDSSLKPLPKGQVGELLVTDLNNNLMPLIRYKIGDYGRLTNQECKCGSSLSILEGIYGRAYDIVKNKAGMSFHGEFFLYFIEDIKKNGVNVEGIQFEVFKDKVLIKVACENAEFDSICTYITTNLKQKFCNETHYQFLHVDNIKRENSGKLRVVKLMDS